MGTRSQVTTAAIALITAAATTGVLTAPALAQPRRVPAIVRTTLATASGGRLGANSTAPLYLSGETPPSNGTPIAYVANSVDNTVTPIDTATNTAGTPIPVGQDPLGIAVTPNGATVYVTNRLSSTVTPI